MSTCCGMSMQVYEYQKCSAKHTHNDQSNFNPCNLLSSLDLWRRDRLHWHLHPSCLHLVYPYTCAGAWLPMHQPWFQGLERDGDTPWPRKYAGLKHPLPPRAVRLLVVPLGESPKLAATAASITREFLGLLPASTKVLHPSDYDDGNTSRLCVQMRVRLANGSLRAFFIKKDRWF